MNMVRHALGQFPINFDRDHGPALDINPCSTTGFGPRTTLDSYAGLDTDLVLAVLAVISAPGHGAVIDVNSGSIVRSDPDFAVPIAVSMPILVLLGRERY
ncbi:hypothetical protein EVAR_36074_1 [Eumeta japonica]|uniref:Uncharacterized protein n=1 Tax=Eumeta variegata TaxID=151549 RepID=A0A4C1YJU2_EUMVA|nr:hypothetical protein EVAR_36074_1 [Eumeta japonica]